MSTLSLAAFLLVVLAINGGESDATPITAETHGNYKLLQLPQMIYSSGKHQLTKRSPDMVGTHPPIFGGLRRERSPQGEGDEGAKKEWIEKINKLIEALWNAKHADVDKDFDVEGDKRKKTELGEEEKEESTKRKKRSPQGQGDEGTEKELIEKINKQIEALWNAKHADVDKDFDEEEDKRKKRELGEEEKEESTKRKKRSPQGEGDEGTEKELIEKINKQIEALWSAKHADVDKDFYEEEDKRKKRELGEEEMKEESTKRKKRSPQGEGDEGTEKELIEKINKQIEALWSAKHADVDKDFYEEEDKRKKRELGEEEMKEESTKRKKRSPQGEGDEGTEKELIEKINKQIEALWSAKHADVDKDFYEEEDKRKKRELGEEEMKEESTKRKKRSPQGEGDEGTEKELIEKINKQIEALWNAKHADVDKDFDEEEDKREKRELGEEEKEESTERKKRSPQGEGDEGAKKALIEKVNKQIDALWNAKHADVDKDFDEEEDKRKKRELGEEEKEESTKRKKRSPQGEVDEGTEKELIEKINKQIEALWNAKHADVDKDFDEEEDKREKRELGEEEKEESTERKKRSPQGEGDEGAKKALIEKVNKQIDALWNAKHADVDKDFDEEEDKRKKRELGEEEKEESTKRKKRSPQGEVDEGTEKELIEKINKLIEALWNAKHADVDKDFDEEEDKRKKRELGEEEKEESTKRKKRDLEEWAEPDGYVEENPEVEREIRELLAAIHASKAKAKEAKTEGEGERRKRSPQEEGEEVVDEELEKRIKKFWDYIREQKQKMREGGVVDEWWRT